MTLYRVELLIETNYSPDEWDWNELLVSEIDENVVWVNVEKEPTPSELDGVTQ